MQVIVGKVRILLPCMPLPQLERPPILPHGSAYEGPPHAASVGLGLSSPANTTAPLEDQGIRVLVLLLGDLALTSGASAQSQSGTPAREPLIAATTSDRGEPLRSARTWSMLSGSFL